MKNYVQNSLVFTLLVAVGGFLYVSLHSLLADNSELVRVETLFLSNNRIDRNISPNSILVFEHTQTQSVPFEVIRIYAAKKKSQFSIIVVKLEPASFNVKTLTSLAKELEDAFQDKEKIKIALTDNENILRRFSPIGAHYQDFMQEIRGLYYLDRTNGKQYLEFSKEKGGPKMRILVRP